MAWGAFAGFLAHAKLLPGLLTGTEPADEKWTIKAKRVFMACVYCVPWLVVHKLIDRYAWHEYKDMFLITSIPRAGMTFTFFFFADYFNSKLGLLELVGSIKHQE